MATELTEIEFTLNDLVGGQPLTPANVDLSTLRGFLDDVEKLVKGDVPGASLADSRVRIEQGSLKVVALVASLLANDVQADMKKLDETGDLDAIQPKRAQIVENWQSRSRRSPSRGYSIAAHGIPRPVRVSNESVFQHGSENSWVAVEKYLTGKVVDLGGKRDPNVHLVLADTGESVRVSATEGQLAAETENQLYKQVTLRAQGEQHLRTKALRCLRLIQFLPQTAGVDERGLEALWAKGREAWKDVKSAADWVERQRGNT